MLEDKLKLALSKQSQDVIVRSSTDGTLKNSRNGMVSSTKTFQDVGLSGLHLPQSTTRMMLATKSSNRYSESSVASRNTRTVKLTNRGLKQDAMTSNYLKKNYDTYSTSYKNDYPQLRDTLSINYDKNFSQHMHPNKQELLLKSTSIARETSPNLQERIFAQISNSPQLHTDPSSTSSTGIPNLLDQIPSNDPIWSYLIPEHIAKDPNINLERVIEENYEYFANLLGLVFQERTQRDFNFAKLSLPDLLKSSSSYSQDFRPNEITNQDPIVTSQQYESQKTSQQTLGVKTSYQHFYKPQPLEQLQNCKPQEEKYPQAMSLLTSYQQNYLNWKPSHGGMMKKVYNKSTGNLPFLGKSSYSQQYKINEIAANIPADRRTLGPFGAGGDMIYTKSYNSETFRPQEIHKQLSQHEAQVVIPPQKYQSPSLNSPGSYQNQYQTTSQRGYNGCLKNPIQEIDILALNNRKVWKKRLLQKFEELRIKK